MADFPAYEDPTYDLTYAQSLLVPRNQGNQGFIGFKGLDPAVLVGVYASAGVGFPAPARLSLNGALHDFESVGFDWFGKVHILPRTKIAFGNIVTSQSRTYEIFSAWRSDVTLTAITNNVGAGVTLPDAPTLPATLYKFTSFLDASSTRLSKVKQTVDVSVDGAPTFDDTIDFLFDTGEEPFLALSGNRIALLTPQWENDMQERWSFLTDVITSVSGKEQRLSLRRNPRQELQVTYLLDAEERQRMVATLFGWQTKLFAVPMWHLENRSTAAASVSATTLQVADTTGFDFRAGGLAVIYESPTKFDVLVLSAVATNLLTFTDSPLLNSYSSNARVLPVRLAYITSSVRAQRAATKLEAFQVSFVVLDNDTGAPTEDTTGWNTYNSRILLDDPNVLDGSDLPEEYSQLVTVIDNDTGTVSTGTRWSRHKKASQKGFFANGRANILKLRRLLLALRGKQKAFYLPTFIDDLTPAANLISGSSVLDISHIGFTRFVVGGVSPRDTIRVTFTDGSTLTRSIVSSQELSSTTERLTLSTTWPANRPVSEISKIEYLELSRFDTDTFLFRYSKPSTAVVIAPVVTVFD